MGRGKARMGRRTYMRGVEKHPGIVLMTLVLGRLCTDGHLGCSWGLSNDAPHSRFAGLRGLRTRPFFDDSDPWVLVY